MQVHGGYGYTSEYHVERYWRESRVQRIAPISNELVLAYLGGEGDGPAPVVLTRWGSPSVVPAGNPAVGAYDFAVQARLRRGARSRPHR